MGAAFGKVDTESGPPSAVPLQHFVVGLAFLVVGASAGVLAAFRPVYRLPHVHLLLVGWVCVTIMGAMTQFVPVWSDVSLYSRRIAQASLVLTAFGVAGLAMAFATERYAVVVFPGALLLVGLWTFVYNMGKTLPSIDVRHLDVTETHFMFALAFVLGTTSLGIVLAADYRWEILTETPFQRGSIVVAHAVFAVFGIVVTTVLGAMYQLVTMFTQTELRGVDGYVEGIETLAYPVGVIAVAAGRIFSFKAVAWTGRVLILISLAAFGVVVLRKLYESRVSVLGHPMLVRYAVAVLALVTWTVIVATSWIRQPLSLRFAGEAATAHVLLAGFVGYVVIGTLYHVFPFLVWVESYSDRLGLEDVPMIDDLYDSRLERADLMLTVAGFGGVTVGLHTDIPTVTAASGAIAASGYTIFVINVVLVVQKHKPGGLASIAGRGATEENG